MEDSAGDWAAFSEPKPKTEEENPPSEKDDDWAAFSGPQANSEEDKNTVDDPEEEADGWAAFSGPQTVDVGEVEEDEDWGEFGEEDLTSSIPPPADTTTTSTTTSAIPPAQLSSMVFE